MTLAIRFSLFALGLLCVAAPATSATTRHPSTFTGSCDLSGEVVFDPAMTNTPQPIRQSAKAAGTCSGTFVDRRGRAHELADSPVTYAATSSGDAVACEGGVATGTGVLSFRYGRIAFSLTELRGSATPLLRLDGAAAGSAVAAVRPAASADPVAAVQACAGSGLETFEFDAHMETTQSISG